MEGKSAAALLWAGGLSAQIPAESWPPISPAIPQTVKVTIVKGIASRYSSASQDLPWSQRPRCKFHDLKQFDIYESER